MHKTKEILLIAVFAAVFISGCDNKQSGSSQDSLKTVSSSYAVDQAKTAWLRDHLPINPLIHLYI